MREGDYADLVRLLLDLRQEMLSRPFGSRESIDRRERLAARLKVMLTILSELDLTKLSDEPPF